MHPPAINNDQLPGHKDTSTILGLYLYRNYKWLYILVPFNDIERGGFVGLSIVGFRWWTWKMWVRKKSNRYICQDAKPFPADFNSTTHITYPKRAQKLVSNERTSSNFSRNSFDFKSGLKHTAVVIGPILWPMIWQTEVAIGEARQDIIEFKSKTFSEMGVWRYTKISW